MSFFQKLEEIRRKPEGTRKKILTVALGIVMFFIVLIWISSIELQSGEKPANSDINALAPWEVVKETFTAGRDELLDGLGKIVPPETYERE